MNRCVLAFTVFASCINAVPSRADFHPIRFSRDPISDGFVGSGFECRDAEQFQARAACEEPSEIRVARQWRDLAERVRRLAALCPQEERARLLAQADEYEARAARWEAQRQLGKGRPGDAV